MDIVLQGQFTTSLFEDSPFIVCIKDVDGHVLKANGHYQSTLGQIPDASNTSGLNLEALEKNGSITEEQKVQLVSGEHTFLTTNLPLWDNRNKIWAVCAISTDITQKKRLEDSLRQAALAAERASQIKSEFLANMSHEIRTPMNAIMGMSELLNESPLNDEQKRYVTIFRKAGESLLQTINDVLDISKIESGHLKIENTDFNLRDIVEDTAELAAPRAFAKGIEVFCKIDPNLSSGYHGDPIRVRQILTNLIGNAIKFTSNGEVRISVSINPLPNSYGSLLFSISDTGVGIPYEAQVKLFQYFQQADASVTKKFGGTGLGLAICKRLVEKMGGKVWLKSVPNEGTTFYFTLPFPAVDLPKDKKINDGMADLRNKSVLIIDDRPTNTEILREMLSPFGLKITDCDNWTKAWELVTSNKFDLAIMEYTLLNGQDASKFIADIKSTPSIKDIGIILLSSDYVDVTRVELYTAGASAVLYKPTRRDQLILEMAQALHKGHVEEVALPKIQPSSPLRSIKILLVDDSEDNRLLIVTYLKGFGHVITESENGLDAFNKFVEGSYDLVLMDMQMPIMDGYTATRKIRDWEKENAKQHTFIVALTAYALKEEQEKTIQAGCDKHLSKPVNKQKILETISYYSQTSTKTAA